MTIFFATLLTGFRCKFTSVAIVCQCVKSWVNLKNDVATFSAISTIRPTVWYIFFATK